MRLKIDELQPLVAIDCSHAVCGDQVMLRLGGPIVVRLQNNNKGVSHGDYKSTKEGVQVPKVIGTI